ncbi:MAG: hypothetical protein J7480_05790 [Microbacteriaceae bacterium]|nr:hypothetical protein [Microbacteriaceae bacterium]
MLRAEGMTMDETPRPQDATEDLDDAELTNIVGGQGTPVFGQRIGDGGTGPYN